MLVFTLLLGVSSVTRPAIRPGYGSGPAARAGEAPRRRDFPASGGVLQSRSPEPGRDRVAQQEASHHQRRARQDDRCGGSDHDPAEPDRAAGGRSPDPAQPAQEHRRADPGGEPVHRVPGRRSGRDHRTWTGGPASQVPRVEPDRAGVQCRVRSFRGGESLPASAISTARSRPFADCRARSKRPALDMVMGWLKSGVPGIPIVSSIAGLVVNAFSSQSDGKRAAELKTAGEQMLCIAAVSQGALEKLAMVRTASERLERLSVEVEQNAEQGSVAASNLGELSEWRNLRGVCAANLRGSCQRRGPRRSPL